MLKRLDTWLQRAEATRPFTESEAWFLFRLAALSEAAGWTLLLTGIAISRTHLPWHDAAVPITGQIHGTVFLIYFGIVIATYSSLRWSRRRFVVAIVAGIPPYGTLVFEQWAAHRRARDYSRTLLRCTVLALIS
jgi:integral membrane protein